MFVHTCTACAKRQLVFTSQITSLTNTEDGIVLAFTCWCGADQTQTTGRVAARRSMAALAA